MGYAHFSGKWVILIAAEDGLCMLMRKMVILIAAADDLHLFLIITNPIPNPIPMTPQLSSKARAHLAKKIENVQGLQTKAHQTLHDQIYFSLASAGTNNISQSATLL